MINNLSVFFPCINEEGNIENTVSKAEQVLKKLKIIYEIIIIDDGSIDSTGKIADKLASKNSNIRVIHHAKNLGYGEALKSGFYNARYDTIVYTDGDGQFDFGELHKFLEKIEDNDLVLGYRIKRQDPFLRKLFGKGWRLTLLAFFRITFKDVDCGFKMIRKEMLQKIPHLESSRGAMINAELAIKAKKYGFRVSQVGVNHYPRLSGRPTGANIKVIIKSYIDLMKLWWELKDQKITFFLLIGIILLALFLRFYKLSDYMTFLGDEGRDAIIVSDILKGVNFPLIGPPTSVGNIYLGPLYYYMMVLPLAIFHLNPAAAAGMNAFLGVVTVAFIYYLGKTWFTKTAGLISAYLYAISSVTIIYSRSSWNPNPAPLFALLGIFSLYKLHKSGNFSWLILAGLSVGAAIQMHYLAVILIPIAGLLWLYEIFLRRNILNLKNFIIGSSLGMFAFILTILPLVFFDLRHNFLNSRAIFRLFSDGSAVKADIFANIIRMPSLFMNNLVGRYIGGENIYLTLIVSLLIIIALLYRWNFWPRLALGVWLIVGLFVLTFYQQNIYDHYFGFLNPVPFLILGSIVTIKGFNKKIIYIGMALVLLFLTIVNFQKNPLLYSPNNQLTRTQNVAKFIISKTNNRDFNFALIAKNNYDSAYQFYLDLYGFKPKQVPNNKTEQLFVVCEDEICDPTHNAKYEIAAFGMSKIDWQQDIYGVKIYRLISNPSGKP